MLSVQFHVPCNRIDDVFVVINSIELKEAFNSCQVNALQPDMAAQIEVEFMRDLIINPAELKVRAALYDDIVS
jgi:hypothetical protein